MKMKMSKILKEEPTAQAETATRVIRTPATRSWTSICLTIQFRLIKTIHGSTKKSLIRAARVKSLSRSLKAAPAPFKRTKTSI